MNLNNTERFESFLFEQLQEGAKLHHRDLSEICQPHKVEPLITEFDALVFRVKELDEITAMRLWARLDANELWQVQIVSGFTLYVKVFES